MSAVVIRKAYRRVPHLPGSRMASDDVAAGEELAAACLEPAPGRTVVVEEKLDGTCMAVWRDDTARSGNIAADSPLVQHRLFALWVDEHRHRFETLLRAGERVVGEWLALAHGTRYRLPHEPFVAFDILEGEQAAAFESSRARLLGGGFVVPRVVHRGFAVPLPQIIGTLDPSGHGAQDPVEGAVWRVEEQGSAIALAKWVRPEKEDGRLLPGDGHAPIWNWRPAQDWMWAAAGGYSGRG